MHAGKYILKKRKKDVIINTKEASIMQYGINLYCYGKEDELCLEKQAELMRQNGFTRTFDFPCGRAVTEKGAQLLSDYGVAFDTLHAPFHGINDIWKNGDDGNKMLEKLLDGVDKCTLVGAKTLIVHLSSGIPAPRINDIGFSRFDNLMEYADKKNIKIAYENQRVVSNIAAVMESYENAGFCWDVGHENCFAFGRRYMPLFGDRVCALHLHDNHKVFNMDEHLIPFDGKCDYDYIAKTLADYKYTGTLMLEVMRHNSHKYDDMSAEEYYERAGRAVRRLDQMIENLI